MSCTHVHFGLQCHTCGKVILDCTIRIAYWEKHVNTKCSLLQELFPHTLKCSVRMSKPTEFDTCEISFKTIRKFVSHLVCRSDVVNVFLESYGCTWSQIIVLVRLDRADRLHCSLKILNRAIDILWRRWFSYSVTILAYVWWLLS